MSHCKCPCKKSNLLSIVHVQLQALPSSQYREKYLNGPDRTLHNMQASWDLLTCLYRDNYCSLETIKDVTYSVVSNKVIESTWMSNLLF